MMLNGITDILAAEGIKTKLVCDIGYNMQHPPMTESIRNIDHVILILAPITRNFGKAMPDSFTITQQEEYKVNGFQIESDIEKILADLYAWKQVYQGDVVDFDYHLMWDHVLDAGGEGIAKVLYQDIRNFDSLGMNGYISCQLQRNAFPTSLAMTVMGHTLWNRDTDFDKLKRELYAASFGCDKVEELCAYFECLSDAFDISAICGFQKPDTAVFTAKMEHALKAMDDFEAVTISCLNTENTCHRESWKLLKVHKEIYYLLGKSILANLAGNREEGRRLQEKAKRIVWEKEEQIQAVTDCLYLCRTVTHKMTMESMTSFETV
jgi:hypothetical protein